jgi:hypothetical protein
MAAWVAMPAVSRSPDGRTTPRPVGAWAGAKSGWRPTGDPSRRGRRPRPDELPPSRKRVRRTRLWMVLLLLTPVCLATISLLAFSTGGPPEPSVAPRLTPPGWYGVTDADFGYAVPDAYQQNTTWTDQNGDFFYGTAQAFVAETLLVTKTSPRAASRPPTSFRSFGQTTLAPYAVHGGHTVSIPGTTFAFEETLTRPGGYHAEVLDTWERDSSTQMWMVIRSSPAVTRTVLASLQG